MYTESFINKPYYCIKRKHERKMLSVELLQKNLSLCETVTQICDIIYITAKTNL